MELGVNDPFLTPGRRYVTTTSSAQPQYRRDIIDDPEPDGHASDHSSQHASDVNPYARKNNDRLTQMMLVFQESSEFMAAAKQRMPEPAARRVVPEVAARIRDPIANKLLERRAVSISVAVRRSQVARHPKYMEYQQTEQDREGQDRWQVFTNPYIR